MADSRKLFFASDYMEGAHPAIMKRLLETNMESTPGYGTDDYSEAAREKIRAACGAPDAEIRFLAGGTQANAVVIGAMLQPWAGVLAAETGHVSVHEAGAIEFTGHKVLTLPHDNGKIRAGDIDSFVKALMRDESHEHMVMPGMVYISQPTEFGTLYSLDELKKISSVCREHGLTLYMDGARLAYALACPENDVTMRDIASLCDAFYIGGTKCGTLYGEAVVIPDKAAVPHFFTMTKQRGAMLAKGRIAGIQFDTLFTDDLYLKIGEPAINGAIRIREALLEKGYELAFPSPTNQTFVILGKEACARLSEKIVMGFWENIDEERTIMRICTSWATTDEAVEELISCL